MNKAVHFKKLKIDRMYGMPLGLKLEGLSCGVNVIYGPNSAGKSSLARALAALLWPDQDANARTFADALLDIEGTPWRIDLEGSRCLYQRNGAGADRPTLPSSDHRDRYQLSLPELLKADNRKFAKAVMQEAVGGVDIEAAARSRGFGKPSPSSGKETKRASETFVALSEEKERHASLDRERRRLAELRKEFDEAKEALRREEFLKLALEFVQARDMRRELESSLRRYPVVLAKLTGAEPEDVKTWRRSLESLCHEKSALEALTAELRTKLGQSVIPDDGLEEGLTDRLEVRLTEIKCLSEQVRQLEVARDDARKREESSWRHIQGAMDAGLAANIDVQAIGELATYRHKAQKLRSRRFALTALDALLREDAESTAPEVLSNAALQLQHWLAEARQEKRTSVGVKTALIAAAVLVLCAGVYAGITWSPVGFLIVLVDVFIGYALYRVIESSRRGSKETYRRDFGTAVPGPQRWDLTGVQARLNVLYQELAQAHVANLKRGKLRDVLMAEAQLSEEEAALDEIRRRLTAKLGIDTPHEDEEILYLVERIAQWQAGHIDVERASAGLDAAKRSLEVELSALHADVAAYGFERPCDAAAAAQTVSVLQKAAAHHAELQRGRRDAEERAGRTGQEIRALEAKIAEVFQRAGLQPDDDAGLYHLCSSLEAYEEMRTKLERAEGVESNRAIKAKSHPLCDEALLLGSASEVERRLEEAHETGVTKDEINSRISGIRSKIEEAERGHALEKARAEYEEALRELDVERMKNFRALAGHLVAEFVKDQTKDQQLPTVFKRARTLFAQITAHRYDLRLEGESFRAYDNVRERGLSLDELSSGTRVQLLLSVRVAFLEEQEQGMKLPLVLDETLANSDDGKAGAIIDAILGIAAGNRQVFYFTCQEDEVAKWKRIADQQPDVPCSFFPLLGASTVDAIEAGALPSPTLFRTFRKPGGLTHEHYGRELGVDVWDANNEPGSLHLWYLVEDCDLLYRLLDAGFERWGQLRHLSAIRHPLVAGMDAKMYARVRVLAEALEAWRDAWSIGRGRKVDRSVLESSGAVSATFLDKVADLCSMLDGNGEAILTALRSRAISGFKSHKADELEGFLIDNGYIDPAEPLTEDEVWAHTVARVHDLMSSAGLEIADIRRLLDRVRSAASPAWNAAA